MLSDWHLFWWFSMQQSPLNGMVGGSHRVRWFADGFWVFLHIWWFLMVVQHRSNDVMVTSSQCDYAFVQAGSLTTSENSHRRKDVQMQPMRLCICSGSQFPVGLWLLPSPHCLKQCEVSSWLDSLPPHHNNWTMVTKTGNQEISSI